MQYCVKQQRYLEGKIIYNVKSRPIKTKKYLQGAIDNILMQQKTYIVFDQLMESSCGYQNEKSIQQSRDSETRHKYFQKFILQYSEEIIANFRLNAAKFQSSWKKMILNAIKQVQEYVDCQVCIYLIIIQFYRKAKEQSVSLSPIASQIFPWRKTQYILPIYIGPVANQQRNLHATLVQTKSNVKLSIKPNLRRIIALANLDSSDQDFLLVGIRLFEKSSPKPHSFDDVWKS